MTRIHRYFIQIEEKFKSFHVLQSWNTEWQQPVFVYRHQRAEELSKAKYKQELDLSSLIPTYSSFIHTHSM